jgi:hypothetical protein
MAHITRRKLLWTTSTGAVAVAGVAAILGLSSHERTASATPSQAETLRSGSLSKPVVAYLNNPSTNHVVIMVGEHEIASDNLALAAAIRSALG